jgi:hypothetical protein
MSETMIGSGRPKYSENVLPQFHNVHHKTPHKTSLRFNRCLWHEKLATSQQNCGAAGKISLKLATTALPVILHKLTVVIPARTTFKESHQMSGVPVYCFKTNSELIYTQRIYSVEIE